MNSLQKRILFFSPTGIMGGAERNLVFMVSQLTKVGYTSFIVLPNEGKLPEIFRELNISTLFISKKRLQNGNIFAVILNSLLLIWKCRDIHIDIIHSNSIFSLYLPIFFGWMCRIPVFLHWADFDTRKGDIQFVNLFRANTTVLAVSKAIQQTLIQNKLKSNVLKLLYNSIPLPQINPISRKQLNTEYSIPTTSSLLAITGRIDCWKGHKYALEALAKLAHLNIHLVIFGEFHTIKNHQLQLVINKLIKDQELADRVTFTGYLENPADILQNIDIVLIPSIYEPFGLVALEAMALEKPIIASNTGGLQEIIIDNETGILVPPKDSTMLANAIETLYNNPESRNELGLAGYQRYLAQFHPQQFIETLSQYYEA